MAQLQLKQGDIRTIIADAPPTGFQFDQWTGDVVNLDNSMASTTIINMPAGNITISASYIENVLSGYGALYNWYAATEPRKITSSDDWDIINNSDCETLRLYIAAQGWNYDGSTDPGIYNNNKQAMALAGSISYWVDSGGAIGSPSDINYPAIRNITGFNAKGCGYRTDSISNQFLSINRYCPLWCSNSYSTNLGHYASLGTNYSAFISNYYQDKEIGYGVRLIYRGSGTPTEYIGNDNKVYEVVTINNQTFIAKNLNETKYRNGDWITGFNGGIYTPISDAVWRIKTTEAMCYYNDDINNG